MKFFFLQMFGWESFLEKVCSKRVGLLSLSWDQGKLPLDHWEIGLWKNILFFFCGTRCGTLCCLVHFPHGWVTSDWELTTTQQVLRKKQDFSWHLLHATSPRNAEICNKNVKDTTVWLSELLWDFFGRTENKARCVSSRHLQTDFFVSSFFPCSHQKEMRSRTHITAKAGSSWQPNGWTEAPIVPFFDPTIHWFVFFQLALNTLTGRINKRDHIMAVFALAGILPCHHQSWLCFSSDCGDCSNCNWEGEPL